MPRYAWVMEVRPGYEDEYRRRHDEIWPEMSAELRAAGLRDYAIFRYGLTLFGTFSCDDLVKSFSYLAASPVNKRWREHMAPITRQDFDPNTGRQHLLPIQFYQE